MTLYRLCWISAAGLALLVLDQCGMTLYRSSDSTSDDLGDKPVQFSSVRQDLVLLDKNVFRVDDRL
jgi:hypothetical protein